MVIRFSLLDYVRRETSMGDNFWQLISDSYNLHSRAEHGAITLGGFVIISLVLFYFFRLVISYKGQAVEPPDAGMADASSLPAAEPPLISPPRNRRATFATDLICLSQSRNVSVAVLDSILGKLLDAGIPDADIPKKLAAAAKYFCALRSDFSDCQVFVEEGYREELLNRLDGGDFDAVRELLAQAREGEWTLRMDTAIAEAEFLAKEAMIDHCELRFADAAEHYAAAACLLMDNRSPDAWHYLIAQAKELCEDGRIFGARQSILAAIEVYHRALGLAGRELLPLEWAATKHDLGSALLLLGEQDGDAENLREAASAYLAALEEWSQDAAPMEWVKAQKSLGDALRLLGSNENDKEKLGEAAQAYRAALSVCTRETAPFDWAEASNRLGNILVELGTREGDTAYLQQAIDVFKKSLDGIDKDLDALGWSMTQNGLGHALEVLAEREAGTVSLREAASAYRAALDDRCLELVPADWASTTARLGDALFAIAVREADANALFEAISSYKASLRVDCVETQPLAIAKTHLNLAYASGALWRQTRDEKVLKSTIDSIDAAIVLINQAGVAEHVPAAELARRTIVNSAGYREMRRKAA